MAKRKSRSGAKSARMPSKPRSGRYRLPTAFRIVPLPVKSKPKRHAHVLGQAGAPPCPAGCMYVTTIETEQGLFCVYQCPGGMSMIRC